MRTFGVVEAHVVQIFQRIRIADVVVRRPLALHLVLVQRVDGGHACPLQDGLALALESGDEDMNGVGVVGRRRPHAHRRRLRWPIVDDHRTRNVATSLRHDLQSAHLVGDAAQQPLGHLRCVAAGDDRHRSVCPWMPMQSQSILCFSVTRTR